jgi:hypothetical protein
MSALSFSPLSNPSQLTPSLRLRRDLLRQIHLLYRL